MDETTMTAKEERLYRKAMDILENLDRNSAVRWYRRHWRDLAETGVGFSDKDIFLRKRGFRTEWGTELEAECFLCEYVLREQDDNCDRCPVDWGTDQDGFPKDCMNIHKQWIRCVETEERKVIAHKIATMRLKKVRG